MHSLSCLHAYIPAYIHAYMLTYHLYMFACTYAVHGCICTYMFIYVHASLRACVHVFTIAENLEEVALWVVLLPCSGAREEKLWSSGMEHPVRVQRIRSQDQRASATGVYLHWAWSMCIIHSWVIHKVVYGC